MPLDMKIAPVDRDGCHERLPPLRGIDMLFDQSSVNLQSLQTNGGESLIMSQSVHFQLMYCMDSVVPGYGQY